MDAKAVPKKFAQLVDAGAYRTRSAELSRITSQVTQKVYDWVVTGLAWLGAKLPAVQTLDDVVALYERAELDPPENVRAYVVYAAGETIVWAPDSSFRSLQDDVFEALNGPPTGGMNEPAVLGRRHRARRRPRARLRLLRLRRRRLHRPVHRDARAT
jgi:hypothetical protein